MSTFKDKNVKYKKISENEKKSVHYNIIEEKHKEIMNNFENMEKSLPKLKKEYNNICDELEKLSTDEGTEEYIIELQNKQMNTEKKIKNMTLMDEKDFETKKNKYVIGEENTVSEKEIQIEKQKKLLTRIIEKITMLGKIYDRNCHINELKDRKSELNAKIYHIENGTNELDYFDDAFELLHDYYTVSNKKSQTIVVKSIEELFSENIINKQDTYYDRINIVDKYLQTISQNRGRKKANIGKLCTKCKIPKKLNIHEGTFTCSKCGECELATMDSDKPAYKDQTQETKSNTYKRSNHCSELLNQSQGKESTDIDEEIFDQIIKELYKIGITDLAKITKADIKTSLNNIGKSNKAEHAVYIINKINGIPVDTIPHELNEIVKQMFSMAEEAWIKHKPENRKNFMNTSYVFHKIFELLDEDELAAKWPLLADDKLSEHDDLWQKICNDWKWEFIPSL